MSPPDERPARPPGHAVRTRRLSTLAGSLVGVAGMGFVVRVLVRDRDIVAAAATQARPGLLLGALAAAAVGVTGIGLAWRRCLRVLGSRLDTPSALRGYFVGQLGKYVPGGVWAIMGRGEWARREGVPGAIAYSSVLLSMGSAYLAAILLATALLPFAGLLGSDADARYALVLLLLPLGFALLHPRAVGAGLVLMRRLSRRELAVDVPPWAASAGVVARQLPSWALIGVATLLVAAAFGHTGDPANIVVAAAISWVLGFVALPVPGGIGVREAAFVALATSLPAAIAATTAVVARLLFVAVDAGGAAATTALLARRRAGEVVE